MTFSDQSTILNLPNEILFRIVECLATEPRGLWYNYTKYLDPVAEKHLESSESIASIQNKIQKLQQSRLSKINSSIVQNAFSQFLATRSQYQLEKSSPLPASHSSRLLSRSLSDSQPHIETPTVNNSALVSMCTGSSLDLTTDSLTEPASPSPVQCSDFTYSDPGFDEFDGYTSAKDILALSSTCKTLRSKIGSLIWKNVTLGDPSAKQYNRSTLIRSKQEVGSWK